MRDRVADNNPEMPSRLRPRSSRYFTAPRGYLMRNTPKRDKSISARQWRKRKKLARRVAREAEVANV